MQIIQQDTLKEEEKKFLMDLWNREYPARLGFENMAQLDAYLGELKNPVHYIVAADKALVAWGATFLRDGEKWFAMIIDVNHQRAGLGSRLLQLLKENKQELNGWVIDHHSDFKSNGQTYNSPLDFYLKNDFEILKDTRLETDRLSAVKIKWNLHQNA